LHARHRPTDAHYSTHGICRRPQDATDTPRIQVLLTLPREVAGAGEGNRALVCSLGRCVHGAKPSYKSAKSKGFLTPRAYGEFCVIDSSEFLGAANGPWRAPAPLPAGPGPGRLASGGPPVLPRLGPAAWYKRGGGLPVTLDDPKFRVADRTRRVDTRLS
jgi:hypothetical protein